MQTLKMKKVRENAIIPKRATAGSAGLDLCACIDEPLTVKAGERAVIPSGIAIALESSEVVALVFARSGLAIKHGISLSNSVGVIDSDYRGEICVGIINTSREDYTVNPGERIAQLVLTPVIPAAPVEVESLDETERGAGGFGSTGRN
ncbi:MAG: dUTP diphosphatase [Acutalibacteraceae bacterium]